MRCPSVAPIVWSWTSRCARPPDSDVLAEPAASGARLPVVIITAHDEPDRRRRCLSAGAAAYLCKPVHDQIC